MTSESVARDSQPDNIIAGPWTDLPEQDLPVVEVSTFTELVPTEPFLEPKTASEQLKRFTGVVRVCFVATVRWTRKQARRIRRLWTKSAEFRRIVVNLGWGATFGLLANTWRFYTASDVRWEVEDRSNYAAARKASKHRLEATGLLVFVGFVADRYWTGGAILSGWWPVMVAVPPVANALVYATQQYFLRHPDLPGTVTTDGEDFYRITHLSKWDLPGQAVESVTGALLAMQIEVSDVAAERRTWGWEVTATRISGDPAAIVRAIGNLETRFDLRVKSLMVQQHRQHAARMTLRMITGDPWAAMPGLADPSPAQTIRKPISIGWRLDQVPALVPILRVQGTLLAASGGGKTEFFRAVADKVMSCTDAVMVDIDPTGAGLAGYEKVMWRKARTPQASDQLLQWLSAAAKARASMLTELGMGTEWQPSAQYPAIVVFVDEFPQLNALGKDLAIQLQRHGRKAGISCLIATQTTDKAEAGKLLAVKPPLGVLGPGCQEWHVQQIISSDARAQGWLPDRLRPKTAEELNDAGVVYLYGSATAGGDEPIPTKLNHTTPHLASDRASKAPERPSMDDRTARAVLARLSVSQGQDRDPVQVMRVLAQATANREPGEVLSAEEAARILGQEWTSDQVKQVIGDRAGRYGQHRHAGTHQKRTGWKISSLRESSS